MVVCSNGTINPGGRRTKYEVSWTLPLLLWSSCLQQYYNIERVKVVKRQIFWMPWSCFASLSEGRVKSFLVEIGILAANNRKFIKSIHAHKPRSKDAVSDPKTENCDSGTSQGKALTFLFEKMTLLKITSLPRCSCVFARYAFYTNHLFKKSILIIRRLGWVRFLVQSNKCVCSCRGGQIFKRSNPPYLCVCVRDFRDIIFSKKRICIFLRGTWNLWNESKKKRRRFQHSI